MAITVHFEHEGLPMAMLLDLVEVPRSHSGVNLGEACLEVLRAFGVEDKVSITIKLTNEVLTSDRSSRLPQTMRPTMIR
jgi:hypothetical protein